MLLRWFRDRRRRQLLREPMREAWRRALERDYQHFADLSLDERDRLCALARVFVAEKRWEGCAGLTVTDEMKLTIAAQACLLILNVDDHCFPDVDTILVYPTTFVPLRRSVDGAGVVHEDPVSTLGEAHYYGPVVLSWASTLAGARDEHDGRNVVYHEFAHKLDMADDLLDGTPRLHAREDYADWVRVMTREYQSLCDQAQRGRATLLDRYGATNVAEFFAVATECFFEKPAALRDRHPEMYDVLRQYYRQDPATRMRRG